MKRLNLLLMMLASLTLLFATSCGKNDEPKETPAEITLAVSGGTELILDGLDITRDITVTASAAASEDIAVSLSSNAAEGEVSFAANTITIKKGEQSASGKIVFHAAKFPKGTPQKKITVTIDTQMEHVTPEVATTDFLVKGKDGIDLIELTISGNNTKFNTTESEQTLTVTATLEKAISEDVAIAIAYDGTADNLKELFKDKTALTIAKDQKTATIEFKVEKGVEGTLKLAFSTTNLKVDLQTKSFSATFAVDKNDLILTSNGTEFSTVASEQTMTVTATIDEAIAEDLDIAITYDGSTENIKTLFAAVTSIKIAAEAKTTSMDFKVPQGTEGTLKMAFAIDNADVNLVTTSLTGTFSSNAVLCPTSYDDARYAQVSGLTVGGETALALPKGTPAYSDQTTTVTANITEGAAVSVGVRNNDTRDWQDPNCHVWVDWNRDYKVTADELMASDRKQVNAGATDNEYLSFEFKAPAGTASGTYLMRIGTNYGSGLSGCANPDADESRTSCDLTINYSNGTVVPVPEPPTFAVETTQPTDVTVPATGNTEVSFNVSLSKAADKEYTIQLTATSTTTGKNGTITPTSVVFQEGDMSKSAKIKFLSADFTSDAISATVTVTGSSTPSLEPTTGKGSIQFKVKGTKEEEPAADPVPLCESGRYGGDYLYTKQFIVGTYTSVAHSENIPYTDLTGSVTADVTNGDNITIKSVNVTSGDEDTYNAVAWIDWNNDGKLDPDERAMSVQFEAGASGHETTSTAALAAPAGTKSGKYSMRIGSTYGSTGREDGCGDDHETFDFTDIIVNYTAQ